MTYPATNLQQAAELIVPDSNSLHEIINGDATKSVILVNGPVPTLRKALTDNFYFTQTTLPWEVGQEETIFNQLREFNGKFYHAPLATEERPISMGTSPDGDPNWRDLELPVADMVVNAYNSSISAQQSKDDAAASAAAAEVSNQQSATNAATTTSDKNTIAGYRSDVEADRAEVAANTTQVASDKAEVATNTVTVSTDKATVEGYKNDALNAKTEAQRWATGVSGSGVNTPSDSNNAFYYSEVARNNANQTFKSGGYFTPTDGQEYPDVTSVEVDTIWLIKFANESDTYTYTTGDLAGETVKNGFMLVYDTPANTFDYIPSTISGATSVNGITPDATGNITIDSDDVGAAQKTYVDTELDKKVDKVIGKGLSDTNFTQAEKDKVAGIQEGAQVNTVDSVAGKVGVVVLDKADVGLSDVNNTSDINKPLSTATTQALSGKVDKVLGKGLSESDYTTAEKTKLANIANEATKNRDDNENADKVHTHTVEQVTGLDTALAGKASSSDPRFTDSREWTASTVSQEEAETGIATTRRAWTSQRVFQAIAAWWATSAFKTKLDGIEEGATKNATDAQLRDRATHTGTQSISTIENLDLALYDSTSMAIVILAGGKLELIRDAFGNAQLFGVIPIQTYEQQGIPDCPFTGIIDAFRKADGTFWSEKRIAIHKSVNIGSKTVSQAGKAPYVNLNFDEFKAKAAELGSGFRLLDIFDNALVNWIILGIISRGGQAPRGNIEWGRAHDAIHEMGTRVDGQVSNTRSGNGATLTGSGPNSWNHDGTSTGFADWVGNVWEWVVGLKMSGGEFVVAEYSGQPESEWLRTGRYINAGHVFSMTAPPSPVAANARWGNFGKAGDYVGHELLQRLMIEPIDCTKVLNGNFWYNTDGERSSIVRASWSGGGNAGPVAWNLDNARASRSSYVGGRLAFGS